MNLQIVDWHVFGSGFMMQLGMIMSIGLQNIYIIRKGIKREYPFLVALTCAVCEVILIAISVLGAKALMESIPAFKSVLSMVATLFLGGYGSLALYRAICGKSGPEKVTETKATLRGSLFLAVGFSLLNPQAIFESILFFGGVAPKFGDAAPVFISGALLATTLWLFSLAAVATYGFPREPSQRFMRVLEAVSGTIMLVLAWSFSTF